MPPGVRNVKVIRENAPTPSFLILAAGVGNRTKGYGNRSLYKYKNKPLIGHQIDLIKGSYPTAAIFVMLGFDAAKLHRYLMTTYPSVHLIYNSRYEETNEAYSIITGLMTVSSDHVVLIYNDIIFNRTLLSNLPTDRTSLLVYGDGNIKADKAGVCISRNSQNVLSLTHSLPNKWAQIAVLHQPEIGYIRNLFQNEPIDKMFGYELFNFIIRNRSAKIGAFSPDRLLLREIATPKDLE